MKYAYRILETAIQKPFEKLLENAGLDPGYYTAKLEGKPFGYGVDVKTSEIKDLVKEGIIDPAAVLTESLRSAVSVAILLLTSGGVGTIYEEVIKAQA